MDLTADILLVYSTIVVAAEEIARVNVRGIKIMVVCQNNKGVKTYDVLACRKREELNHSSMLSLIGGD